MKQAKAQSVQPAPNGRARWALGLLGLGCALALGLLAGPVASQAELARPVASGGGEYIAPHDDGLDGAERARIEAMIDGNIERLAAEGRLPATRATEQVMLGWPLAGRAGFNDPGYHAVTGFVDHQPAFPNQVRDYACGGRSYDTTSGYNHQGTDFYLWPFAWNKMASGDVEIVAAADGVIVGRDDGNSDQSCSFGGGRWNAVYVRHADGSIAWYGHMKRGSLTPKGIGAAVRAGEYLGQVGSSGNSTGPHLHFELYAGGQLTDPYAGSCNPLEGGSRWASQPNYYDSGINKLMTGTAPFAWGACPAPDITHEAVQFQPGDRVTFTAFFRDQVDTLPARYRIVAPDGTIFAQWEQQTAKPHYTLSYWWWSYDFPAGVKTGTWRFEATYNGRQYAHEFAVGQPGASVATPTPAPTPDGAAITPVAPPALDWAGYFPLVISP